MCQELTGKQVEITPQPEDRAADIPWYISDSRKVADVSGWQPEIGLERLLQEIYDWLVAEETTLRPILGSG
jgi:CDP-paratose 2-epimerase